MKLCPNCHEEVEDNYDLCWNCNYSFIENKIVEIPEEIEPETSKLKLDCLRCKTRMRYSGVYKFHEGTRLGIFGDLFELFTNRESFDVYVCPLCGKIEFFIPKN